jgi:hypothetical protein
MNEGKDGWKYFTETGSGRGSAWMAGGVQVFLERLLRREAEGIPHGGMEEDWEGMLKLETALRRAGVWLREGVEEGAGGVLEKE